MRVKLFIIALFLFQFADAQTDTLYSKKEQKISCTIIEINEVSIKYKKTDDDDGVIYVVNRGRFYKYTLKNGYSELLIPYEIFMEHNMELAFANKTALKIHPFSLLNNKISCAIEVYLNHRFNLEAEGGYIDNTFNNNPVFALKAFNRYNWGPESFALGFTGIYFKPGLKIFFGDNVYMRKYKLKHPLKGRFMKIDFALSNVKFTNVTRNDRVGSDTRVYTTDVNCLAYGGFINYGAQILLANIFTLDYYVGIGIISRINSYSNSEFRISKSRPGVFLNDEALRISNLYAFHVPVSSSTVNPGAIAFTAGFRLGYIIPSGKK